MSKDKTSVDSLIEANRSRVEFSGHGNAQGAAGERMGSYDPDNSEFLRDPGQFIAISPGPKGFEGIRIGVSWDNVQTEKTGFFSKLVKKVAHSGVDLDIGCLYEMQDGTRGAIQAFGEKFGDINAPPFIKLSGDERTGNAKGIDEFITINGQHWDKIKRLLIYIYIYDGAPHWAEINPYTIIDVPGEHDLVVTLSTYKEELCVCAVGGLENVRGSIKLTNYTEYFPGHNEMDRAFGFGLDWGDGKK